MNPPPLRVADSLAEAGPRDLVHIDRKGKVVTGGRARIIRVGYWGLLTSLVGAEAYLGYTAFGVLGLSVAAALGGYVAFVFTRVAHLRRGLGLLLSSSLDEAEAAFERVATGRFTPRRMRARGLGGLSAVARLRGRPELALKRLRQSLLLRRRGGALAEAARHTEAQLLARLGRVQEARAVLAEASPDIPEGEYPRLTYHTAELYIAFCDGRHQLDDDELHERASFALGITSAAPLLALLAWAFEQRGDDDMRQLLLDEAKDRHPGDLLSGPMPRLQRWLDGEDLSKHLPSSAAASAESAGRAPDEEEVAAVSPPEKRARYLR